MERWRRKSCNRQRVGPWRPTGLIFAGLSLPRCRSGVEAVIDKDLASGLLARGLDADMFVMLTDVPNVYTGFGTESQRPIRAAHPDALEAQDFAIGSMRPKVLGACKFVRETGQKSAIGKLSDLSKIMKGEAGTLISNDIDGVCLGA